MHVRYSQGSVLGRKKNEGTYEGVLNDSMKGLTCVSGDGVDPNRDPTCKVSCASCVTWVDGC